MANRPVAPSMRSSRVALGALLMACGLGFPTEAVNGYFALSPIQGVLFFTGVLDLCYGGAKAIFRPQEFDFWLVLIAATKPDFILKNLDSENLRRVRKEVFEDYVVIRASQTKVIYARADLLVGDDR